MSNLSRQIGILALLCVLGLFASDAQAGYVSLDSSSNLASFTLESNSTTTGSTSSSLPADQNQDEHSHLRFFDTPNMAMHLGPSGSGGMSSVSSPSGGHAPVAMIVDPESLTPSLITPLVIGDEPFSPRMLIADIFRPPQG